MTVELTFEMSWGMPGNWALGLLNREGALGLARAVDLDSRIVPSNNRNLNQVLDLVVLGSLVALLESWETLSLVLA